MAFVYFLPGVTAERWRDGTARQVLLAERGLAAALADVPADGWAAAAVDGCGPDGSPGLVLAAISAAGERPARLGYYPGKQWWETRDAGGLVWMSYDQHRLPGPAELARCQRIAGEAVTLADGRAWEIPVVRRPLVGDGGNLPRSIAWDADGRLVRQTLPEFAGLFADTLVAWDWLIGTPGREALEWEWLADYLARLLAVNYRLGKPEISRLGLLREQDAGPLVQAAVEWSLLVELHEKKTACPAPAWLAGGPGVPDAAATLAPASPG